MLKKKIIYVTEQPYVTIFLHHLWFVGKALILDTQTFGILNCAWMLIQNKTARKNEAKTEKNDIFVVLSPV